MVLWSSNHHWARAGWSKASHSKSSPALMSCGRPTSSSVPGRNWWENSPWWNHQENHGKTMGKSWENHGKIIGNHGKTIRKHHPIMAQEFFSWNGTSPITSWWLIELLFPYYPRKNAELYIYSGITILIIEFYTHLYLLRAITVGKCWLNHHKMMNK